MENSLTSGGPVIDDILYILFISLFALQDLLNIENKENILLFMLKLTKKWFTENLSKMF